MLTKGEIMYTLAKRTSKLDRWTIDSYDSLAELMEEVEYLLETGWYIGEITKSIVSNND
jgi:hypothetical protein